MSDTNDIIEIHGIVLRPETSETLVEGRLIPLTKTEFHLLHFLAGHAGTTYARQQLIEAVHGVNYPATDRSVDSQVTGVRKKLGAYGHLIEAVRGVGYRFKSSGA